MKYMYTSEWHSQVKQNIDFLNITIIIAKHYKCIVDLLQGWRVGPPYRHIMPSSEMALVKGIKQCT